MKDFCNCNSHGISYLLPKQNIMICPIAHASRSFRHSCFDPAPLKPSTIVNSHPPAIRPSCLLRLYQGISSASTRKPTLTSQPQPPMYPPLPPLLHPQPPPSASSSCPHTPASPPHPISFNQLPRSYLGLKTATPKTAAPLPVLCPHGYSAKSDVR